MAGQQGNHKPPTLVYAHHGGVGKFILDMGSDGPDSNARRPDKKKAVRLFPGPGRPGRQTVIGLRPYFTSKPGRHMEGSPQGIGQTPPQRRPPAGKGDDRRCHWLASRNSWVKVGSYSLERW